MDISALLAALIGAASGAAATGIGALQRSRTTQRTAARLVYAELERNSAAVAFYRAVGTWPAATTSHTAWNSHSETLARDRQTAIFQTVSQGYSALENLAYIAGEEALSTQDTARLVEENVGWLRDALRSIGRVAQIPDDQLAGTVRRLQITTISQATAGQRPDNVPSRPLSLLPQLLDMQLASGQRPEARR